jgi:septation ring formation regulator EzrA
MTNDMPIEVSAAPEWLTELAADNKHHLRSQIVQTVRQYCITANKPYRQVWKTVYERFEEDTGLVLGNTTKSKIDFVQANDRLGDLLKVVQTVTAEANRL